MLAPHKTDTKVKWLGDIPQIIILPLALQKMEYYVKHCDTEIGWLGQVVRQDNYYIIKDVYLFKQEVHSTTCEITPEGLAEFAEEILNQENGLEIYNSIRLWGHSHVNMTVSASGQDDSQMKLFKETGCDWFLRTIANKHGDMEFTLFDYKNNYIVEDVPWQMWIGLDIELEDSIKKEIESKVQKKTYTTLYHYDGEWVPGKGWVNQEEIAEKDNITTNDTENEDDTDTTITFEEAKQCFSDVDWFDIACLNLSDAEMR